MNKRDLEAMSIDGLWTLHEEVTRILSRRINSEKRELERRLAALGSGVARPDLANGDEPPKARRKYPRVLPKYANPSMPTQTWSGRGKKPRWLVAQLRSGHKIEEFSIDKQSNSRRTA